MKARWSDFSRGGCEKRSFTTSAYHSEMGRSTVRIVCPFCDQSTRAYVWSLSGCGKRCSNPKCGALFGSGGTAIRMEEGTAS